MAYTVLPSFDYANFKIDYKNKKVNLDYPHKDSKALEFFVFLAFGIFFVPLITGVCILALDVLQYDTDELGLPILLMMVVIWIIVAYKTSFIRKAILDAGQKWEDTNQIFISGGLKRKTVEILNVGNYFTDYELAGDYSKYINTFEIKCVELKKKKGIIFPKAMFKWKYVITFDKVPKEGYMRIHSQIDGSHILDAPIQIIQK